MTAGMRQLSWFVVTVAMGCTTDAAVAESLSGTATASGTGTASLTQGTSDGPDGTSAAAEESSSGDPGNGTFDLAPIPDAGRPVDLCGVGEDIDGIGDCTDDPLSESFNAEVQWSWDGGDEGELALLTPLVANLTDDNGDGSVDLCDTPDIVIVTSNTNGLGGEGRVVVFDGNSGPGGDIHWASDQGVSALFNPALGDLDGDGLVEVVAVLGGTTVGPHALVVYEHDGTEKWRSSALSRLGAFGHIALADLDADGDVEIMADGVVFDHQGELVFAIEEDLHSRASSGFAVDLDGDGDLEFVHAAGAHHHDGTEYFRHEGQLYAFPQVGDIDGDGLPEVLYSHLEGGGLTIYEHDGTLAAQDLVPSVTGIPAALHDMDGDGSADLAIGNGSYETPNYGVVSFAGAAPEIEWTVPVEGGCCAGSTAFDFLGDGTAEAMFADDRQLYIFDELGGELTTSPRVSGTGTDYPVVADVDNDGSAEIVVVAASVKEAPTLQVVRDRDEGWVQARRIWNQHAYHVTNVREDGTIPTVQPKNWETLNTFRTQAQLGDGGVCDPPEPAG